MTSRRTLAFRVALLSIGIGAFFTAQLIFQARTAGRPLDVRRDILQEALYWLTWAVLSPLIVMAVRRWPIGGPMAWRAVARHVAISAVLVPVQTVLAFSSHWLALSVLDPTLQVALPVWLSRRTPLLVWGFFEGAFFYGLIVVVYTVLHFRRLYVAEQLSTAELAHRGAALRSELDRAQLDALRSQLRPHFLFNTLNAVSVLVMDDPPRARRMLIALGSLLRRSLDEQEHTVTLRQELAYAREYIEIQETRFGDRLEVTEQVDPATLDVRVPVFLLQPLVENAIVHGAAPGDGITRVSLRAFCVGEALQVEVEDHGPGVALTGDGGTGIGLRNTRRRLAQLFGDEATVTLASVGAPGQVTGARATVTIPIGGGPCAS